MTEPNLSPLHSAHRSSGARFIVFGDWRLPVHYGSILAECRAVRSAAGMFDVSHMGRIRVVGSDAVSVLQRLGTNDLSSAGPGKAQYTLWCDKSGGTIDDLIVLDLGERELIAVVNASRRDDDLDHLTAHAGGHDVAISDDTFVTAMVAVQGPEALDAVASVLAAPGVTSLPRFGVTRTDVAGVGAIVSRTGYTGEDGVEIIVEAGAGPRVWELLRASGVAPCGLGARDALRMEMGYPLYGHELGPDISPLEAGVGFAVALDAHDFIGAQALRAAASGGLTRRLVGFVCAQRCIPAPEDRIEAAGLSAVVTSGATSITLDASIGLAFASGADGSAPDRITSPVAGTLQNRGREIAVRIQELPLIERKRPKT